MNRHWTELDTQCENARSIYLVNRVTKCFLRPGCEKYKCKYCGPRKMRRVARRMELIGANWFFTFTPPSDHTAPTVENDDYMKARIRTYVNWMRRQPWGKRLKQGWCRETANDAGDPFLHYHAVFKLRSLFLPFAQMQARAHALGLGTPDFERVWRQGPTGYMTKYLTKSVDDALGSERRRFALSPGYHLLSTPDWHMERFFRPEQPEAMVPVVRLVSDQGVRHAVPFAASD